MSSRSVYSILSWGSAWADYLRVSRNQIIRGKFAEETNLLETSDRWDFYKLQYANPIAEGFGDCADTVRYLETAAPETLEEIIEGAAKQSGRSANEVEEFVEEALENARKKVDGGGSSVLKIPDTVNFDSKQLGKKWGKHKTDYPDMKNYMDYQNYANDIFSKPDQIIYDAANNEYLYIKGDDLLRIGKDGEFISLYPGAQSERVISAIENGGTIWP